MEQNDRGLALLSHALGFFTSFIGPLIIYLVADEEKSFAKQHAREALNFQITLTIAYIVSFFLTFFLIGILGFMACGIANIVFSILAMIAANDGKDYLYPVSIRMIK